jgi:DNA-binding NarL/FixJ family response regulator
MIRVLIADDQSLVRTGFRLILECEPDLCVVGEAADGRRAVELAAELSPDVVLMDIRMPVLDGIAALRAVVNTGSARNPPKVVMLTTFDLDEYVYAALAAGASGFLLKDVKAQHLVDAIHTVYSGEALLAPSITRRVISQFVAQQPRACNSDARLASLTAREREVLTMMARGLSNPEIAAAFVVGEATVKTHVSRILSKLGVRDRTQAVITAYEHGLVRASST